LIVGCLAWYVVGLWSLVGGIMSAPAAGDAPRAAASSLLTITLTPDACASLVLDRATGATSQAACTEQVMALGGRKAARKQNRLLPVEEAKAMAQNLNGAPAPVPQSAWSTSIVVGRNPR
jgi:hypothetical protein